MLTDGNTGAWSNQDDPFGEDFYLMPYEEEIQARAEQVHRDNQDALRHFVELAIWEALDNPDHLKVLLSLLWLWGDVDPKWMAEASFMSIRDVRNLAESQPITTFNCLDCGTELTRNRWQRILMQRSVETYCEDASSSDPPANLLCGICQAQRKDHAEQQRRLAGARYEALLKEYRRRPYADRRTTREWMVLKRQVHRRDGYRCRLCGCDGNQLHVHHRTYTTYAEERLEDLITLCQGCHAHFHFLSEAS
jgi:5-methylcytosine-specific restriction endonuclease McrA